MSTHSQINSTNESGESGRGAEKFREIVSNKPSNDGESAEKNGNDMHEKETETWQQIIGKV